MQKKETYKMAGRGNLSKANSHNTKKQASKSRDTSTSSPFSSQGQHFFGEPKYVLGEIDFKNPTRDDRRYREPGFKEMSRIVKSVPDPKVTPPRMNLADIIGKESIQKIQKADRIVFHSVGDTGAKYTRAGLQSEALVTDKMAADFNE